MFRHFIREAFCRAQTLRAPRSRVSLARVFIGVSATAYCASTTLRTIHADARPSTPESLPDPQDKESEKPEETQDSLSEEEGSAPFIVPEPEDLRVWVTLKDEFSTEDRLRQFMFTFIPEYEGTGIARADAVVVASNDPVEDKADLVLGVLPTHFWSFFGVYDGHNGSATSSFLYNNLIYALLGSLADLYSKYAPVTSQHTPLGSHEDALQETSRPFPPAEEIDRTIKDTFLRVDDDIVNGAVERAFAENTKEAAINLLATAHAGSCALVGFYESDSRLLRVALTGDSRAVLGRPIGTRDARGQEMYDVHVLSVDQNAHNPLEEARMSAEHPGETIMANGRVIGWGMSRAFGDAAYKWGKEIQERLHADFLGDRMPPKCKTPPYFTAEPEVTTTEVRAGDFMVLASDGLWDCLTSEEVVGLVGMWLTRNAVGPHLGVGGVRKPAWEREELPVKLEEDKTVMYRWWKATKRFINVDRNVAVHLARNALGGADTDLTAALLKMSSPRSRRYRDDISIQVVFFD